MSKNSAIPMAYITPKGLHKTGINVIVKPTQEGALKSLQDSWECNRCYEHTCWCIQHCLKQVRHQLVCVI